MQPSFPNLDEVERRPRRYWNADGLPEISMGALWMFWGVLLALPRLLPPGEWLGWYRMVVPFLMVGAAFSSQWVTRKLKERITFPRGGYVRWLEPSAAVNMLSAGVAALVGCALIVVVVKGRQESLRYMVVPLSSVLIAGALLVLAFRWKLHHYLVLSVASLAAGLVAWARRIPLEPGMILLLLTLGALSVLTGTIRLRRYLRAHSLPAEGAL